MVRVPAAEQGVVAGRRDARRRDRAGEVRDRESRDARESDEGDDGQLRAKTALNLAGAHEVISLGSVGETSANDAPGASPDRVGRGRRERDGGDDGGEHGNRRCVRRRRRKRLRADRRVGGIERCGLDGRGRADGAGGGRCEAERVVALEILGEGRLGRVLGVLLLGDQAGVLGGSLLLGRDERGVLPRRRELGRGELGSLGLGCGDPGGLVLRGLLLRRELGGLLLRREVCSGRGRGALRGRASTSSTRSSTRTRSCSTGSRSTTTSCSTAGSACSRSARRRAPG